MLRTDISALYIPPSLNNNSRLEKNDFSSCNSWICTWKRAWSCWSSALGSERTLIPSWEQISFCPTAVATTGQACSCFGCCNYPYKLPDPRGARSLEVSMLILQRICKWAICATWYKCISFWWTAMAPTGDEVENLLSAYFSTWRRNFIHYHEL